LARINGTTCLVPERKLVTLDARQLDDVASWGSNLHVDVARSWFGWK
jgi:hypothetical protein